MSDSPVTSTTASDDQSIRETLSYVLTLSRPRFWFYLAGPVLVGIAYSAPSVSALYSLEAVLLFGYFLLPANSYLYGVNDLYDRSIDRINPKKADIETRYEGQRVVPVLVVASGAVLVLIAFALPSVTWPWLAGFLILGWAYSAPPLRFKTTPVLDSLSNGLYVLPGAAAYAALAGSHPPTVALVGGWVWAMGMHTFSAIPDIEPDRASGIETTATLLGEDRTYLYCGACWIVAAVAFGLLDYRLGALMLVYPAMIVGIGVSNVDVSRAYWWFPAINTTVGALLTMGGLWWMVYG